MPYRDLIAGALIALALPFVAFVVPVKAQSDNPGWYSRQYNSEGQWCCNGADGHAYDGAYVLNPDGSITLPVEDGDTLTVEAGKVLRYNPADPNPTGTAVIWYQGQGLRASSYVFCFALGPLT